MDIFSDNKKYDLNYIEYDENVILHQRELFYKEKYSTLKSGMYIENRIERFVNAKLFDDQMEIILPESFGIMPDSYLKIKYPSQFRPQIILTKADLSVNLGFTLFSQGVSEEPGSNQDNVTNGYVQFVEADYFLPKTDNNNNIVKDINGEIVFERVFKDDREAYFGRADIGDDGNPLVHESIKMVNKGGADLRKNDNSSS